MFASRCICNFSLTLSLTCIKRKRSFDCHGTFATCNGRNEETAHKQHSSLPARLSRYHRSDPWTRTNVCPNALHLHARYAGLNAAHPLPRRAAGAHSPRLKQVNAKYLFGHTAGHVSMRFRERNQRHGGGGGGAWCVGLVVSRERF